MRALLVITVAALAGGGIAWLVGSTGAAHACWIAGTVTALMPAIGWVVAGLRRKHFGVDVIAVLSLAGTLAVGEYAAGAVIAVMLAGGHALEAAAERRATRDVRALLQHQPRTARLLCGTDVHVVPLDQVDIGNRVVVGSGEVVPVDGRLTTRATLDESTLTGEPQHVHRSPGERVRSGVVNAGPPLQLDATANARDSTYAGIVRLARQASAASAPVVRLADRYAAWLLPLTLMVAGVAWAVSGSAVRAVAVLVVATPCPLLLAAPVAIVSGMSRASRLGVVVRSGAALETLGRARTLVLDKTGTLTSGRPAVVDVLTAPDHDAREILALAAAADRLSPHVFAGAIVDEATRRGLDIVTPVDVVETAGSGVSATVAGHRVQVGQARGDQLDARWAAAAAQRVRLLSAATAWVLVDGVCQGAIVLRDPMRRQAPRTLMRLRAAGLSRIVMLTGDQAMPAREIGTILGLDDVYAQLSPRDKVAHVQRERDRAVTVMVGDGVNDAPALASADVGVAVAGRGATASSEAADIVLTTDRLDRLADAMDVARWSRRIAVQSAVTGMALSALAMAVAAVGWLPPAAGALVQEGIDVAVILNALRALRRPPGAAVEVPDDTEQLLQRFATEHARLADSVGALRTAADRLLVDPSPVAVAAVRRAYGLLVERILPHEDAEEALLYPALARLLGNAESTVTMSRGHAEIRLLADRIGAHLTLLESRQAIDPEQTADLMGSLYGLHELLRLHFAQEEEAYFALAKA